MFQNLFKFHVKNKNYTYNDVKALTDDTHYKYYKHHILSNHEDFYSIGTIYETVALIAKEILTIPIFIGEMLPITDNLITSYILSFKNYGEEKEYSLEDFKIDSLSHLSNFYDKTTDLIPPPIVAIGYTIIPFVNISHQRLSLELSNLNPFSSKDSFTASEVTHFLNEYYNDNNSNKNEIFSLLVNHAYINADTDMIGHNNWSNIAVLEI